MLDARRKLQGALAANGYLAGLRRGVRSERSGYDAIMSGWDELDRFLRTDPRDVGCDQALRVLHGYVELVLDDESGAEAARRYPGVAAHLLSCGPCAEDYQGLLLAARADRA
jgi:hypothetical protein